MPEDLKRETGVVFDPPFCVCERVGGRNANEAIGYGGDGEGVYHGGEVMLE